ncbi:response regulator [Candidatus Falkowbacteria bacterium]|nr:response regulator [Candidatus Falkowbacteria bacterium]
MRILVADDEPTCRGIYEEVLKSEGHDVVAAEEGIGALGRVNSKEEFDLLIFDEEMPNLSGPALLEIIRQKGITTPAILIGSDVDRQGADKLHQNFARVCKKPIPARLLIALVREMLAEKNKPQKVIKGS